MNTNVGPRLYDCQTTDGAVHSSVSAAEIRALVNSGAVHADSPARGTGTGEWLALKHFFDAASLYSDPLKPKPQRSRRSTGPLFKISAATFLLFAACIAILSTLRSWENSPVNMLAATRDAALDSDIDAAGSNFLKFMERHEDWFYGQSKEVRGLILQAKSHIGKALHKDRQAELGYAEMLNKINTLPEETRHKPPPKIDAELKRLLADANIDKRSSNWELDSAADRLHIAIKLVEGGN